MVRPHPRLLRAPVEPVLQAARQTGAAELESGGLQGRRTMRFASHIHIRVTFDFPRGFPLPHYCSVVVYYMCGSSNKTSVRVVFLGSGCKNVPMPGQGKGSERLKIQFCNLSEILSSTLHVCICSVEAAMHRRRGRRRRPLVCDRGGLRDTGGALLPTSDDLSRSAEKFTLRNHRRAARRRSGR